MRLYQGDRKQQQQQQQQQYIGIKVGKYSTSDKVQYISTVHQIKYSTSDKAGKSGSHLSGPFPCYRICTVISDIFHFAIAKRKKLPKDFHGD